LDKHKLYTEQEIPDGETRRAVNCFYAPVKCNKALEVMCKAMSFNLWRKCPKHTGKIYEEEKS
jgi:hypothetical protein